MASLPDGRVDSGVMASSHSVAGVAPGLFTMPESADPKIKHLYEFGPFRVDPEKELLLRGDEAVALTPKTFQILLVLVRHSNEIVTKEDMLKTVWPDTFVEEANLSRNIFLLRKALGETPQDHQYIVTVPGRGDRFAEDVQLVPQLAPDRELSIVAASHAKVEVEVKETRDWRWFALAGLIVVAIVAGAFRWFVPHSPVLTEKDTIVLADFANSTGDPVFDGTLRQGMAAQLEQSPYLTLLPDQRIQQALELMAEPAGTRISPGIAREICERTQSAAVADGSIHTLGTHYVLGLRATNCRTGAVLDEEQVEAARKEDVLKALDQMAGRFRRHIGESIRNVQQHNMPLEEATTSSLEALKVYSAARSLKYSEAGYASAVPLLKRAVEIDPDFAIAYAFMGHIYGDMGESSLSAENASKAYQLRAHANERERFFIDVTYDRQVSGNIQKAHQTLETWARTYPRDRDAHGLLSGFSSQGLGNYQEAIEQGKMATSLDPDWPIAYWNVAAAYIYLDRVDEASAILRQAAGSKLDFDDQILLRYFIAFLKTDIAGMAREAERAEKDFAVQDWMLHFDALVAARSGKLRASDGLSQHAVELARQAGQRERAAVFIASAAASEAFLGKSAAVHSRAGEALELSKGRDVEYGAGVALALAGDSSRAHALTDDLQSRFAEDTTVRFSYLPTLLALLALNRGEPDRAIQLLEVAVPYEEAVPGVDFSFFFGGLYPAYVRGQAYLAAHRESEAVVEFQKILDHRGIVGPDPIGALAHLQLGRAYELSGNRSKARSAYQEFLSLWKDADTDIPILQQAKIEYAKLE
jgi:eukaryotic-like serine/threonine-protein kinase